MSCLSTQQIVGVAGGDLQLAANSHLENCEVCRLLVVNAMAPREEFRPHTDPEALEHAHGERAADLTGHVLCDRFEVTERAGSGGMGAVFFAHDRSLGQSVAIKVLLPEWARATGSWERIKREVVLARRISHRNVCRVFDLYSHEGMPFVVMERVQGTTLSKWLTGNTDFAQGKQVLLSILDGLMAMHAGDVVHRDLKPSNIMVADNSRAVLLDFGLAGDTSVGSLTVGVRMGSPLYWAPEQARGQASSVRADIYSYGVIVHDVLNSLSSSEKRKHAARISRLRGLAAKCLQFEPTERYATAAEVRDALLQIVDQKRSPRVISWAAGAIAAACLLVSAAMLANPLGNAEANAQKPIASVPQTVTSRAPVAPAHSENAPAVEEPQREGAVSQIETPSPAPASVQAAPPELVVKKIETRSPRRSTSRARVVNHKMEPFE